MNQFHYVPLTEQLVRVEFLGVLPSFLLCMTTACSHAFYSTWSINNYSLDLLKAAGQPNGRSCVLLFFTVFLLYSRIAEGNVNQKILNPICREPNTATLKKATSHMNYQCATHHFCSVLILWTLSMSSKESIHKMLQVIFWVFSALPPVQIYYKVQLNQVLYECVFNLVLR